MRTYFARFISLYHADGDDEQRARQRFRQYYHTLSAQLFGYFFTGKAVLDENYARRTALGEEGRQVFSALVGDTAHYRNVEVADGKNASGSNSAVRADDIIASRGTNDVRNHGKAFIGTGDDKCFHCLPLSRG